jgi:hypothetical protein
MPIIDSSSWPGAPFWQFNGHLQTVVPGIGRRVKDIFYERERIQTPDGDFLDLDWMLNGHDRLVILTHGLEGDSNRHYIRGTAKIFAGRGWDVLAWNCRSCSGEMNRAFRMYHHGDTEDISAIVNHTAATGRYRNITMVGYSMGANMTMKYLGVYGDQVPEQVRGAAVFSAPCDLESGAEVLDRWDNTLYRKRFLWALSEKVKLKDLQFPGRLQPHKLKDVKRWRDFDEWFSAPICGYRDAADFYQNASAKYFLAGIRRPTLLVNALNDPILTPACMPIEIAREHPYFYLELTTGGGHCGFITRGRDPHTWAERRAVEFCEGVILK